MTRSCRMSTETPGEDHRRGPDHPAARGPQGQLGSPGALLADWTPDLGPAGGRAVGIRGDPTLVRRPEAAVPGHAGLVTNQPAVHAGVRGGLAGRPNFPTTRWESSLGSRLHPARPSQGPRAAGLVRRPGTRSTGGPGQCWNTMSPPDCIAGSGPPPATSTSNSIRSTRIRPRRSSRTPTSSTSSG